MAQATAFGGFPRAAFDFYEGLSADNSKSYWQERKDVYKRAVQAPMAALVEELEEEFGPGKVFRPYRDTRFSADKSPYKITQTAICHYGVSAGFYLELAADGLTAGAGFHAFSPEHTRRYRTAVDDDAAGGALARMVEELTADGFAAIGEQVKTRPRGCPADHPRLELMRYSWLGMERHRPRGPELETPDVAERVRADWRRLRPLADWMDANIGEVEMDWGRR